MPRRSLPAVPSHPVRRAVPLSAALLLASAFLAACGDDGSSAATGDDPTTEAVVLLEESQAEEARLAIENLPDGWAVQPASDDEEDGEDDELGCLSALDSIEDEVDSEYDVEVDFAMTNDFNLPGVNSTVSAFDTEESATKAMGLLRAGLEDCDRVDVTDPDDGTRIVLDVALVDALADGADEQITLTATGTINVGMELEFGMWMSMVRIGNHTTMVGISDIGTVAGDALDAYTDLAVERLVAVLDGEEPPATQGPEIVAGAGDLLG